MFYLGQLKKNVLISLLQLCFSLHFMNQWYFVPAASIIRFISYCFSTEAAYKSHKIVVQICINNVVWLINSNSSWKITDGILEAFAYASFFARPFNLFLHLMMKNNKITFCKSCLHHIFLFRTNLMNVKCYKNANAIRKRRN